MPYSIRVYLIAKSYRINGFPTQILDVSYDNITTICHEPLFWLILVSTIGWIFQVWLLQNLKTFGNMARPSLTINV